MTDDLPKYPRISIVTPSFNQGKFLEKTILSVIEQGYPNLEYIIIDGGSTDKSVEIIRKYEQYLAYWVSEPDRGQSHAINKGFERATGEIFGWLNSDDWYHPGALQAVAEAFAANPEAGAVVGAGEMVDEEGKVVLRCEPFDATVEALFRWHEKFFWQPSCFFKKTVWVECGPLDEDCHYAMDLDLWFRIAEKFSFGMTDALLSLSLKHADAKTTSAGIQAFVDAAIVIISHGGVVQGKSAINQEVTRRDRMIADFDQAVESYAAALHERDNQLNELGRNLLDCEKQLQESNAEIHALRHSLSWKITAPLRTLADKLKTRPVEGEPVQLAPVIEPYHVKMQSPPHESRPKVVHALANFMTGGSSRLVVDLIEQLGHLYEQEVITYFRPDPPHYLNIVINEFRDLKSPASILAYLQKFKPAVVHVHYWGDVDCAWYELVFAAARSYGCQIVENVNTPVMPHVGDYISRYVYVSDYVRTAFGGHSELETTIYPGSDFSRFFRHELEAVPDNCVGMVYRLEKDKLDEQAIDVFIKIVKQRPRTRVLIVGGGSFLELYRNAVNKQGVADAFEFAGYVAYTELPVLYARMSIFVAPVWKESFGQVSPFAMSMGLPVVGYDVGALGEIIADQSLLAPAGDSDRLAAIALELLDDRERRLKIGRRNCDRSRQLFSVAAMIDRYTQLYANLTGTEQ